LRMNELNELICKTLTYSVFSLFSMCFCPIQAQHKTHKSLSINLTLPCHITACTKRTRDPHFHTPFRLLKVYFQSPWKLFRVDLQPTFRPLCLLVNFQSTQFTRQYLQTHGHIWSTGMCTDSQQVQTQERMMMQVKLMTMMMIARSRTEGGLHNTMLTKNRANLFGAVTKS